MFQWNESHVINAAGGRSIGNWCSKNISTDTRSIKKGDLFIALKGKNFDGHNFVYEAFAKGAVAAIVSENKWQNFPTVIVKDTLKALHNMASYYIRNVLCNVKVIAVTGSVGKTTTKDMLYTVLSQYGISHATRGNLNNNIGVPLTILSAPQNCEYLILEMGMSRSSEIRELSEISNPDIAVITNIEHAHTANFSSLFDVAQAKLEVLHGLKSDGILVLNKDNKYLSSYLNKNKSSVISFGKHQDATVRLLNLKRNESGLNLNIQLNDSKIVNYHLHTHGEHFSYSVLAVVGVAMALKLNLPQNAFETFQITKGRGNICYTQYNGKHLCLIDDSYNANPASMKAAIKTLGTYSNKRKVAILGDMLELGDESVKFHTDLLDHILACEIDKVHAVGSLMLELHKLLPRGVKGAHFDDSSQLKNNLDDIVHNGDVILIKGSQGMHMNIIIQQLCLK
ncbi:MAG: UDP-N-acetylmuramoyl-tripeptide--D-alanyl-D-alanine ligase [Wolbachia endosymbiont of Tyrophagus putrescentiae]|nr:UDP-N-acetylmuramoyl-tripeptide--D-alanyl-D-alanine ligase [Wolbachia endosymbiont of Tyrophagus putrescentiae]